jgi:general secretion pathway protein G
VRLPTAKIRSYIDHSNAFFHPFLEQPIQYSEIMKPASDPSNLQLSELKKNVRGFTLVEILIVLALIGIVAGLAMSNLGGIFGQGKVKAAQTWVNSTGEAYVNSYFALVGNYPKSLADLKSPPDGIPAFVKRAADLQDPWGNDYLYQYPGTRNSGSFDLSTTTPEGQVIGNWDGN